MQSLTRQTFIAGLALAGLAFPAAGFAQGAAKVGATVTGEAIPLHIGRRSSVWQTRITSAEGKLLALVLQTQMTVEG